MLGTTPALNQETAAANLIETKNRITMAQNPHPLPIVIGTALALLVIYIIFLAWIAPSPSGTWIDADKNRYAIRSSRLLGTTTIYKINPDPLAKIAESLHSTGYLKGLRVNAGDMHGAWIDNQIIWIKPDSTAIWNREINVPAVSL